MIEEISEDRSILHPKKKMLDPQKFVPEMLIEKRDSKNKTPNNAREYESTLEFQLQYFEDFFVGSFQIENLSDHKGAELDQIDDINDDFKLKDSAVSDFSISKDIY